MRRITIGLCLASGSLFACSPSGPVGTRIPSSEAVGSRTEGVGGGGGMGGAGGAPATPRTREGQEVVDYAERPQPERWCWFMNGQGEASVLYEIDMDTGIWGKKRELAARPINASGNCFTLFDNQVIWVDQEAVAAVDLSSGEFTYRLGESSIDGITANATEIITDCADHITTCSYPSVAALLDSAPTGEVPDGERHASLYARTQDWLYGAWHAGETVTVYDRETGLRRHTILLEDYDDWFSGLAVVGNRVIVHNGYGQEETGTRIATFDLETGDNLDNLYLGQLVERADPIWVTGLVCGGAFQ